MSGFYDHLELSDWPFTVVPRPDHCTFIAGRSKLAEDINTLLHHLSRRDTSSIHIFWSWFGAGKTHSLFFLKNRAEEMGKTSPIRLIPTYTEFPKSVKSFLDLYCAYLANMDVSLLSEAFLDVSTSQGSNQFYNDLLLNKPDLAAALTVLAIGAPQKRALAARWIKGDPVLLTDLRRIGISERIDNVEKATKILSAIFGLFEVAMRAQGFRGSRIIWLIDEFQRLSGARQQVIQNVNEGLHSLFNSCPTGFSPIISFSGKPDPTKLPDWFSAELRDRIGITKVMILPPLQVDEALLFIRNILSNYRLPNSKTQSVYYPFSEDACTTIIDYVKNQAELRPRFIMDAFNAVLEAAEQKLEAGEIAEISSEYAKSVLAEHVIVADEES